MSAPGTPLTPASLSLSSSVGSSLASSLGSNSGSPSALKSAAAQLQDPDEDVMLDELDKLDDDGPADMEDVLR